MLFLKKAGNLTSKTPPSHVVVGLVFRQLQMGPLESEAARPSGWQWFWGSVEVLGGRLVNSRHVGIFPENWVAFVFCYMGSQQQRKKTGEKETTAKATVKWRPSRKRLHQRPVKRESKIAILPLTRKFLSYSPFPFLILFDPAHF